LIFEDLSDCFGFHNGNDVRIHDDTGSVIKNAADEMDVDPDLR
jgi:hypothetical protein